MHRLDAEGNFILLTGNHRTRHTLVGFLRAKLLYRLLQKLISDNLLLLTNEAPCNEAKFLEFVQDAERHFKQKARQMHNLLTYFNTTWLRRLSEYAGKYEDVFEIHRTLLLANLATNIQVKVRDSAFKFILNGGSLNSYAVIRWIAASRHEPSQASMPTFSSPRRPIFLLARKLEQSASTRPATERSCPVELLPNPARPEASRRHRFEASRIMTLMATFGHWALFIGPADCSTDNSKLPPRGGLLCELERDEDGYISMSAGPVVEGSLYGFTFSVPTGYTTYSDKEIQDIGKPSRHAKNVQPGSGLMANIPVWAQSYNSACRGDTVRLATIVRRSAKRCFGASRIQTLSLNFSPTTWSFL